MAGPMFQVFGDIVNKLKFLTIIIGIIDLGFMASVYKIGGGISDFLLVMIILLFIISFIWFVLIFLGVVNTENFMRKIDLFYHLIGGLLLLIATFIYFVWVITKLKGNGWIIVKRFIATFLAFGNAVIYGYVGYKILKHAD